MQIESKASRGLWIIFFVKFSITRSLIKYDRVKSVFFLKIAFLIAMMQINIGNADGQQNAVYKKKRNIFVNRFSSFFFILNPKCYTYTV